MPELRAPATTSPRKWTLTYHRLPLSLYEAGNEDELHAVLIEREDRVLADIRSMGMYPVTADLKVELFAVERAAFKRDCCGAALDPDGEDQSAAAPPRRLRLEGQAVPAWAGALEACWTCPVVPTDKS